jgi:hypothetical protein
MGTGKTAGSALPALFAVAWILSAVAPVWSGDYVLESAYDAETGIIRWHIHTSSGSATPFADVHVWTADLNPNHYALVEAPVGWQMSISTDPVNPFYGWISLCGTESQTEAVLRVR